MLHRVVNHTVSRTLDLFDIHLDIAERWAGMKKAGEPRQTPSSTEDEGE